MAEPLLPQQLFDLYKIAIDEYRFEVKLNWDRTVYYLTLNSGIIAVATGLLKAGSAPVVNLVVASVFMIGVWIAIIGIKNVRKGHQYYRRTIVKKTILEDQLGLTKSLEGYSTPQTLAIGTTISQHDHEKILNDTDNWLKRPIKDNVTSWMVVIFRIFCAADIFGAMVCLWLFLCNQPSAS